MPTTTVTITVTDWQEAPYDDAAGKALAEADWATRWEGELTAEGRVRCLMIYTGDDQSGAEYVSLERVTGTLAGREGSFVLRATGSHDAGGASSVCDVVEHSGTGQLAGLRGRVSGTATGMTYLVTFEYELERD